jgi:membrane protein DedA with SNARE-associated domain
MAGAAHMPWPRFAVANASGAFAWAATVATIAMLAGPTGALVLAAAGLSLGGVTMAAGWWSHRRRRGRRAAAAAVREPENVPVG